MKCVAWLVCHQAGNGTGASHDSAVARCCYRYDGFKNSDKENINTFAKENFSLDLEEASPASSVTELPFSCAWQCKLRPAQALPVCVGVITTPAHTAHLPSVSLLQSVQPLSWRSDACRFAVTVSASVSRANEHILTRWGLWLHCSSCPSSFSRGYTWGTICRPWGDGTGVDMRSQATF